MSCPATLSVFIAVETDQQVETLLDKIVRIAIEQHGVGRHRKDEISTHIEFPGIIDHARDEVRVHQRLPAIKSAIKTEEGSRHGRTSRICAPQRREIIEGAIGLVRMPCTSFRVRHIRNISRRTRNTCIAGCTHRYPRRLIDADRPMRRETSSRVIRRSFEICRLSILVLPFSHSARSCTPYPNSFIQG